MVGKISEDEFNEVLEKVNVEVLSNFKMPEDTYFESEVEQDIVVQYKKLIHKMTYRVNKVLDNEWIDTRTVSGNSNKLLKTLSGMYRDILHYEQTEKHKNNANPQFKLSHSQIQQKLREIEQQEGRL